MAAWLRKWRQRRFWCFANSARSEEEEERERYYREEHPREVVVQQQQEDEDDDEENVEEAAEIVQDQQTQSLVLSKKPSIVLLSNLTSGDGTGIGIIIRDNLVLTSHGTIPSVNSAKHGEMTINYAVVRGGCCPTQATLKQKLLPLKFFITSRALDMTVLACGDVSPVVAIDPVAAGRMQAGSKAYILGALVDRPSAKGLRIGPAMVTSDNGSHVTFDSEDIWLPGSAGFNSQAQFAFIACQPQHQREHLSGVSAGEIFSWLDDHLPCESRSSSSRSTVKASRRQKIMNDEEDEEEETGESSSSSTAPKVAATSRITACACKPDSPKSERSGRSRRSSAAVTPVAISTYTPSRRFKVITTPSTHSSSSSSGACLSRRPSMSLSRRHSPNPNPRQPGVSYSVPPSPRSGRSGRSSRTASYNKRASPCFGVPSHAPELDDKFQDFLHSTECPLSSSGHQTSDEEEETTTYMHARRGRPHSVESTKKHIFRGPLRTAKEVAESSDNDVYVGVGYRNKHIQQPVVTKSKASSRKRNDKGCAIWHH